MDLVLCLCLIWLKNEQDNIYIQGENKNGKT
jgi:hypothetical protein